MAYAQFPTDDGKVLIYQIPDDLGPDASIGRTEEAIPGRLPFTEAIRLAVRPIAKSFLEVVNELEAKPDDLSVEFGMRIHYRAGAIVSSELEGAHFKVTLRWSAK
jgi:Trypsin-co-occurring domain 1